MVELTKVASLIDLTTLATNKILPINECRSLCILSKPTSQVAYKDQKVAKDKKRSQYLKSPYIDPDNMKKCVGNKNDIESQYDSFKNDPNRL